MIHPLVPSRFYLLRASLILVTIVGSELNARAEPNFPVCTEDHVRITARRSELTEYLHVVGQPVRVNVMTNPASMLSPPRVKQQVKPAVRLAAFADTTPQENRSNGAAAVQARRLKVSPNGRYFVDQDGKPFFYLADTGWEILHRLTREEAEQYLDNRAAKGFTVIMVMGLTEYGGLDIPNRYGHLPLTDNDPTRPNEAYFKHMDDLVDLAAARGLWVALLPTWGDKVHKAWGKGPQIFNVANARVYGEFLGKRYQDKPVIWVLGGDRSPVGYEAIWKSMAEGLAAGDQGAHLMSYHGADKQVGRGSSPFFQKEKWLGFNMTYSGHAWSSPAHQQITRDRALTPVKPTLDSEPNYENHPYLADGRPFHSFKKEWDGTRGDAHQMRLAAYWAMLAGAAGHTYGCHDIWQFYEKSRTPINHANTDWRKAMDFDGAKQMGLLRKLFEARPWYKLVPDQSLIASGQGEGAGHVQAARAEDGSFALAYLPQGGSVTIQMDKLSGHMVAAHWFNPRDGIWTRIGENANAAMSKFTTPSSGPTSDWVLVLDDTAKGYAVPNPGKGEQ